MQCQLESLTKQKTPQDIRKALRSLPPTLEQTYCATLARIQREDFSIARQTLLWVTFALRPMTLEETSEAIIIGEGDAVINNDVRLLRKETLLEICGSLLSYDASTTELTLAHSSVEQYLVSPDIQRSEVSAYYLDKATADNAIVKRCLKYLLLPAFTSGCCLTHKSLARRYDEWPLLEYLATTLFDHLDYINLDDEDMTALLFRFFATHKFPRGGSFGAWVQAFIPSTSGNIEASTPLYYASRFGLLSIVRLILSKDGTRDLELPGGVYRCTPLHVAAWAGRAEVVEYLLQQGANVKEVNKNGISGLMFAIKYGYTDIERMLREAGATLDGTACTDFA